MTASLCDGELPLKDRAEQAGWRRRPIGRASAATLDRITVLSNSSKYSLAVSPSKTPLFSSGALTGMLV